MKLSLYQIYAFTSQSFGGNPACIIPLKSWLPYELMLKITKENAVAETAFFIGKGKHVELRWFTPEIEIDLCGHATLATSHCLFHHLNYDKETIHYKTKSGSIFCRKASG